MDLVEEAVTLACVSNDVGGSLVGNAVCHRKTAGAAKRDGRVRDFNPGNIIKLSRLLEKESIGASNFQQTTAAAKTTNEFQRACKFASQHRFTAAIISVTVSACPGKIIFCVVGVYVETSRVSAA